MQVYYACERCSFNLDLTMFIFLLKKDRQSQPSALSVILRYTPQFILKDLLLIALATSSIPYFYVFCQILELAIVLAITRNRLSTLRLEQLCCIAISDVLCPCNRMLSICASRSSVILSNRSCKYFISVFMSAINLLSSTCRNASFAVTSDNVLARCNVASSFNCDTPTLA